MSRESRITASSVAAMREAIAKSREHGIKANLAVDLEVLEELLDARDELARTHAVATFISEKAFLAYEALMQGDPDRALRWLRRAEPGEDRPALSQRAHELLKELPNHRLRDLFVDAGLIAKPKEGS